MDEILTNNELLGQSRKNSIDLEFLDNKYN